jgi:uncharacterized protein involved in exopolysaccharide biosynthesis
MTETVPPETGQQDAQPERQRDRAPAADPERSPQRVRRTTVVTVALLIVAAFAVSAVSYSLLQPKSYGAQADFLVTPRPELSDTAVDRAMRTQEMIVTSSPVLQSVAAVAGVQPLELEHAVSAGVVGRSNVLRLTVTDRDPAQALRLVQLITTQYLRMTLSPSNGTFRPTAATILSPARILDHPLGPRPWRALAAGTLLGVLVAAAAAAVLVQPWAATWPPPYWR